MISAFLLIRCSASLPVIASSGLLEVDKLSKLTDLGVDEMLAKPYGVKDILEAVSRGLRKK